MLTVHHGGRAEALLDVLADLLAVPAADPFTTEVVSVPTRGVERWLQQRLARRLGTGAGEDGIAANIAFPFPGRFVRDALGIADETDPWLLDSLTWEVLVQLRLTDPDATYQRAAQIARLFDRYAVYRPGLLHAWRAGYDTGPDGAALEAGQRWQPELWRRLLTILGDDPAARTSRALEVLRRNPWSSPLPERVVVFAVSALPAVQTDVVSALAVHRDVHLLVLHPSPGWWRSLDAEPDAPNGPPPVPRGPVTAAHPLLRTWGQVAFESRATLVAGVPRSARRPVDDERTDPPPTTLLGRIQHDVRAGVAPGDRPSLIWSPTDRSVQVHACHGRTRQVEVLRDSLAHLLDDDSAGLELRDVVVLCPDLDAYRPLLTSVLGTLPGVEATATPRFPLSIAGSGGSTDAHLVDALFAVLTTLRGRCTASAVESLASVGGVRRTFGFTDGDLARIPEWIESANVRWGLDGEHLAGDGIPQEVEVTTWEAALDRLLLGLAMTPTMARLGIGDRRPCDAVDLDDAPGLGKLADLVVTLRELRPQVVGTRTAAEWHAVLRRISASVLTADPSTPWEARQLERLLESVAHSLGTAPGAAALTLSLPEVLAMLAAHHQGRPPSGNWGSGSITVCGLGDLRGVPHDVVCILGLDDEVLRPTTTHPDDLLVRAPSAGDRDPRVEQRALLLDAVMSARKHLVITYAGNDVRTNQQLPPATPLAELLDVIDACSDPESTGEDDTAGILLDAPAPARRRTSASLVTFHPRQAFAERNLLPGALGLPGPWSFDRGALDGALARRAGVQRVRGLTDVRLPARQTPDPLLLDELVAALTNPVRSFVESGLGLRIPRTREERSDLVVTSADALGAWGLSNLLLELTASADRTPEEARVLWHRLVTADGVLPPGRFASRATATACDRVDQLMNGLGTRGLALRGMQRQPIELTLPSGLRLVGEVRDLHDGTVVVARPARVRAKELIDVHLRVLAIRAAGLDCCGVVAGISDQRFQCQDVDIDVEPEDALTALDHLVEIAERTRVVALPIPPWVAASWAGALDGSFNRNPLKSDLFDASTALVFGDFLVDDLAEHVAPGEDENGRALAQRLWHHLRGGGDE